MADDHDRAKGRARTRTHAAIAAALVLATLGVYAGVRTHDFIEFDDPAYVSENPRIRAGLTLDNLVWLATGVHGGNWHPLTTLSHMADCELFGVDPRPPLVVNVLLHAVNASLLFLVLARSTGRTWPGAFVAGLFALHPLHVESVAWLSERKDVLSALFWLLAMWCYVGYARAPTPARYPPAVAMLALGLLAKPMVVTLPFVLLLWDSWPLGRWRPGDPLRGLIPLFVEKIPMFLLAAAACAVTLAVQSSAGALMALDRVPILERLALAATSYAAYLGDMVWPVGLAIVYPLRLPIGTGAALGASLLLGAVTAAAVVGRRPRPYLLTGWLWYLGTLVPVIGLVQVGSQARADRYTYLPLVGVFVMIAWAAAEVVSRKRELRPVAGAAAVLILVALGAATRHQVALWRDGTALFRHALAVTRDNYRVDTLLGTTLAKRGDYAGALPHFERVVRAFPDSATARYELGLTLVRAGDVEAGILQLEEALRLDPNFARAHDRLGYVFGNRSDLDRALEHYREFVRLEPRNPRAMQNLAIVQFRRGQVEDAVRSTKSALALAESLGRTDLAPALREQLRQFGGD